MLGAIAGDIIGSVYEGKTGWMSARTPHFKPLFHPKCRFTDDTVLTIAVAESILHGGDLVDLFKDYARRYPGAGYGGTFRRWAASEDREPYQSWGNGSAMRVSPVGFAYDSLDEVLLRAKWTAEVTHDHPEAIKGAQATAAAVFLARTGGDKEQIRDYVERKFGYRLDQTIDEIRPGFQFDVSCRGTVPPAIRASSSRPTTRRRPPGGLAGRRRGHPGLHRRRDRPGVLRRRAGRYPRPGLAGTRRAAPRDPRRVRGAIPSDDRHRERTPFRIAFSSAFPDSRIVFSSTWPGRSVIRSWWSSEPKVRMVKVYSPRAARPAGIVPDGRHRPARSWRLPTHRPG